MMDALTLSLCIAVYLSIGVVMAAKTMDAEMVVAPSNTCLWFYFFMRMLLWPLLFIRGW